MQIIITKESKIDEITLSEEEVSALETDMFNIAEWITNAIHNKARKRIDDIVTKSGRGSKFTDNNEKLKIISDLKKEKHPLMESAKEKTDKIERKLELPILEDK
jgi:hypothetical protein